MSQEKLRVMLENAENRINQRIDDHHTQIIDAIGEIRIDFRAHVQNDKIEHDKFREQFTNIYKATAASLAGIIAWIFK